MDHPVGQSDRVLIHEFHAQLLTISVRDSIMPQVLSGTRIALQKETLKTWDIQEQSL